MTSPYRDDLPRWLALGLRMLEVKHSGDSVAWEQAVREQPDTPLTLSKFMRLASFLQQHYPEMLSPNSGMAAGSAVVLELAQLHDLSADMARKHAGDVFSGKTSVRELRSVVANTRTGYEAEGKARPKHPNHQYSEFSQRAITLLLEKPELLKLENLIELRQSTIRSPLMPKLVAKTEYGEVAVDVRAPDVTASRTLASAAAMIASRLAVLRLRFERVIMVMPANTEPYASETTKLLTSWVQEPGPFLHSVEFLLIEKESASLLHKTAL